MKATKRIGCPTATMLIGIMSMVSPAAETGDSLENRIATLEKTAGISSGDTLLTVSSTWKCSYLEMKETALCQTGSVYLKERELLGASISGETGGNISGNITHLTDLEFFPRRTGCIS